MLKRLIVCGSIAALALAIVGCKGDQDTSGDAAKPSTATTTPGTGTTPTTPAPAPGTGGSTKAGSAQVGLTEAGKHADTRVGSHAGGTAGN